MVDRKSRQSHESTPPDSFAEAPPPRHPSLGEINIGQMVFELQSSVGQLMAKVDRLISDVGAQGDKVDTVRHQISFVKGALWVIGGLIGIAIVGAGLYLRFGAR
jgi:hypothetical protein